MKARLKQKYTRKIWICLVEYSSSEVSDRSEVPRMVCKSSFYLVKEVKLIRVSSIELNDIMLAHIIDKLIRNIDF